MTLCIPYTFDHHHVFIISTMVGTIEVYSSSTAATAGMAAVIVVLVLIIVALSGAIIAIWYVW